MESKFAGDIFHVETVVDEEGTLVVTIQLSEEYLEEVLLAANGNLDDWFDRLLKNYLDKKGELRGVS